MPGTTTLQAPSGEVDIDRYDPAHRRWRTAAVAKIRAEANRSSDTHLISVPLPAEWNVDLYLKDESTHPTGSLKHRLARSLSLYALCNGWIRRDRPVVEASSGSTAVSEAYFARLIGVPFIAVMASGTSRNKIDLIELHGGQCHFVDRASEVYDVAAWLAEETGGHYMDQFTYAERATTGGGTTTSPNPSSLRWPESHTPSPSGSSRPRAPVATPLPSPATSATPTRTPGSASPTPRTPPSFPAGRRRTPQSPPASAPESRESDDNVSNPASSAARSTE